MRFSARCYSSVCRGGGWEVFSGRYGVPVIGVGGEEWKSPGTGRSFLLFRDFFVVRCEVG